jgi:hypothetical protein
MVAGDITTVEIPVMRKDYEHNPFTIYEPEKPILLDVLLGTKHVPIKKLFLFNGQDVYTIEAGHDIVSGTWFLKQASFRRVCSVDDFLDGTYFTQTSA